MSASMSVEVLFNYDYNTAEGRHITITKGDTFTLLSKATEEWWKVCRGEKDKFYVPANYVKVIEEQKLLTNGIQDHGSLDSLNQSSASADSEGRGSPRESEYANSAMMNLSLQSQQSTGSAVPGEHHKDDFPSPVSETVEYANMAMIQEIMQRKHLLSEDSRSTAGRESWEMHTDYDTGRVYYYNNDTKETTWDSPVMSRKKFSNSSPNSSSNSPGSEKRLSRVTSFRKGWTETIDSSGEKTYVHNATGEKWNTAIDNGGKGYYYKEGGSESLWELPEINVDVDDFHSADAASMHRRLSDPDVSIVTPDTFPSPHAHLPRHIDSMDSRLSNVNSNNKRGSYTLPANMSLGSSYSAPDSHTGGFAVKNSIHSQNSHDKQKKGHLFRAKISEGKRKLKKSWSLGFIVASDSNLIIYKDEKSAASQPGAQFGKPEAIIDLQHATVAWSSKDKSSRKNVLEVISASGTGYLFQHEDSILMHQWHVILQGKVQKFTPSSTSSEENREIPENNNNNPEKPNSSSKRKNSSRRYSKYGGGKNVVYTVYEDDANFPSPPMLGPAGEITRTGIREKLRSFLTRRPSQEALEKKGIFKAENVFGSRLQFVCDREQSTVPKFVLRCIEAIEEKGLDVSGLYRISGNQAHIQKLRYLVDSTEHYNLKNFDVNVLTGALKLFFRELQEPLVPFQLYNALSESIREKDATKKLRTMKLQLATMPRVNLDTLKCLFAHLVRVVEHVNENKMQSQNLAIILGPTLMWPEVESSAIAVNMMCQNSIVEYIITNFDRLF